eukprot:TRINITY_DN13173_c0_g1_i1.p2 TRINITY_DN13173_c0_g1~~TRINITY_DN13173_c0_g1_i1.p2  ORF type:complete len:300 (+),score=-19.08 TRINITY_DN13173_c0_g1_i1:61-960(+)
MEDSKVCGIIPGMIKSMTGFRRESATGTLGVLTWELRSVNHRYLDVQVHLPAQFSMHMLAMRKKIQNCVKRGKVEAVLRFHPSSDSAVTFSVNEAVLSKLAQAQTLVAQYFPEATWDALKILSWHGVVESQGGGSDAIVQEATDLLDIALAAFEKERTREGAALQAFMQEAVGAIAKERETLERRVPEIVEELKQSIHERLNSLNIELDPSNLARELVPLVQRLDVTEEVQRFATHLREMSRVLEVGGVVGRRLEFLLQEAHREINSLGAKAKDVSLAQGVVEIKVLLEQLREQVQNIE